MRPMTATAMEERKRFCLLDLRVAGLESLASSLGFEEIVALRRDLIG